jgi:hypothetical protein
MENHIILIALIMPMFACKIAESDFTKYFKTSLVQPVILVAIDAIYLLLIAQFA